MQLCSYLSQHENKLTFLLLVVSIDLQTCDLNQTA